MKGLFIPDITSEMFRNGCLEGIEALMAEGEIYDIEYDPSAQRWIPCSEEMPPDNSDFLLQFSSNMGVGFYERGWAINTGGGIYSEISENEEQPLAWMPLPKPYKEVE